MKTLFSELTQRGYIFQTSSDALEAHFEEGVRTLYLGIDPTGESLHVGHFSNLMLARMIKERGHNVVFVAGGATGMIGDPSGKSEERNLLSLEDVERNTILLKRQLQSLLGGDIVVLNNYDWISKISFIDFLRDTGKLFSVNTMLSRDSVSTRLSAEQFFSYTEFSYSLLQAYDFWYLYNNHNVTVQIGGSDQWGNMVSGIELIRRREEGESYVLTSPLIINRKTGKKFGKTEGGAVWLDRDMTSPYALYQFWLSTEDEDVAHFLKVFTVLPEETITELLEVHTEQPEKRLAQKRLAFEVTSFIHGTEHANNAEGASSVLFGDASVESLDEATCELLKECVPSYEVSLGATLLDVLVDTGIATSKRDGRELLSGGAISLNKSETMNEDSILSEEYFVNGIVLVKKGKREYAVLYM